MTYGFENLSQTQTLEKLFEQYKKEMLYLRNFSKKTLQIYQEVFNRWLKSDLFQGAGATYVVAMRVWKLNDHRSVGIVRLGDDNVKVVVVLFLEAQNDAFDLESHRFNADGLPSARNFAPRADTETTASEPCEW